MQSKWFACCQASHQHHQQWCIALKARPGCRRELLKDSQVMQSWWVSSHIPYPSNTNSLPAACQDLFSFLLESNPSFESYCAGGTVSCAGWDGNPLAPSGKIHGMDHQGRKRQSFALPDDRRICLLLAPQPMLALKGSRLPFSLPNYMSFRSERSILFKTSGSNFSSLASGSGVRWTATRTRHILHLPAQCIPSFLLFC